MLGRLYLHRHRHRLSLDSGPDACNLVVNALPALGALLVVKGLCAKMMGSLAVLFPGGICGPIDGSGVVAPPHLHLPSQGRLRYIPLHSLPQRLQLSSMPNIPGRNWAVPSLAQELS